MSVDETARAGERSETVGYLSLATARRAYRESGMRAGAGPGWGGCWARAGGYALADPLFALTLAPGGGAAPWRDARELLLATEGQPEALARLVGLDPDYAAGFAAGWAGEDHPDPAPASAARPSVTTRGYRGGRRVLAGLGDAVWRTRPAWAGASPSGPGRRAGG